MDKEIKIEKAKSFTNEGLNQARKKQFNMALDNFQKALLIFEELDDKFHAAFQKGNIGSVYRDMGEYDRALEEYKKALPFFEEVGYKEGIADQSTNIAYIHVMKGELREALEYYRKALSLYEEIKNGQKYEQTRYNIEVLESEQEK